MSLSDEASAEIASKLCGQIRKLKATYAIQRNLSAERDQFSVRPGRRRARQRRGRARVSPITARRCFSPHDFALLGNCQAICLPYDGVQSVPPRRVYLKPHYLPADLPYWHAKRTGQL